MKQVRLRQVLVCCAFLLLFAFSASAQEATIVGTVTDASGSVIPNVTVTVTNTDTGQSRKLATNAAGQYVVPGLINGQYAVKAEAPGFKADEKTGITLNIGDRDRIDFSMQVGETKESVTVEATPVAVQTDSGEVSNVINGTSVSELATDGRNVYSLAILVPGAANGMPTFNVPTSAGGNANVSYDGQRQNHNIWLADGSEEDDRGGAGGAIVNPSLEALGEFRVLSSNYSAEYGLSSAGTISMVFKSGTRDFHAEAWEFVRNNDFDANDFFRNRAGLPTSDLHLNVFGFNAGGPVTFGHLYNKSRSKTFFFYNQEWRKLIQQGGVNTTVPQSQWYTGNLSTLGTQLHVPSASLLSPTQVNQWAAAGLHPGDAITGNIIPSSLLSANAQALLKAGIFPAPNQGTNSFVGGNNLPTNVREELVRIDHQFSDKFWVFGHWVAESVSQSYGPPMWSGVNVPTVGNVFGNPSYTGVIHATNAISPSLINEVAFNYNGNRISIIPTGTYQLSSASGFSSPTIFGADPTKRIPGINLQGSTGTNFDSTSFPWHNQADDYQVREDLSWTHGAHQMKMGGGWSIYKKTQDLFGDTQGQYGFNGLYTGNDFADFLLGYANSYSELALQDAGHWNAQSPFAYFQDNWRVNKRLTLNLGLRWDGIPHTYEANHRMSNFYPNEYNPADAAVLNPANTNVILPTSPGLGKSPNPALGAFNFYLNGMGITGVNGNPNGMVNDSWNNWGPRIGFAYDVSGNGKTVVRGGVGTMFERIQGNDMYNSGSNVPFSASVNNSGVPLGSPNTSLATGATNTGYPIGVNNVTALNENNYKSPVTYQYSVGVEQQLARGTVFSATYVGNQNRHQFAYREFNLPAESALATLIQNPSLYNLYAPYTGYHDIRMGENAENSHYNGLQFQLRARMKDLQLQAAYTYSRAIDPAGSNSFGGDNSNTDNPYNYNYDKGPAWWDVTHIGLLNFVYDIPIFRGTGNRFEKTVIGGWQVSGIWSIQSGFPLYITLGGTQGSNGLPESTNFPDFSGTVSETHSSTQWFSTSGFSTPALGAWGNYPKGKIRGPGRDNWNLALFKNFLISEAHNSRFELRFESFNTFNHTQFNGVGTTFSNSSQFGVPTSAYEPRTLQFGARLIL